MPDPYPKSKQLGTARRERRTLRKVATASEWKALRAVKGDRCRLWGYFYAHSTTIDLHHLVPRSQGGDDVADNLVPLCRTCHEYVTTNAVFGIDGGTPARASVRSQLAAELTDAEHAYIVGKMGEAAMSRLFGV